MAAPRTGRRPGNPDTAGTILDAARATFAELGFARTSIRRIAAAAGVDPALVHHYFGTKDQLFLATVAAPIDPAAVVATVLAGSREDLGPRLIAAILAMWDSEHGQSLVAVLRTALADPAAARSMREFIGMQVIGRIMDSVAVPDERERRGALVASQVLGVIVGRYVVRLAPLTALPTAELVASVGPVLQAYLTGPLPELPVPDG